MAFKKPMMVSAEKIRKAAKESGKSAKSLNVIPLKLDKEIEYYDAKEGTANLIIVPYIVSDPKHPNNVAAGYLWPRRDVFVHPRMGPANETVLCLSSIGQKCPICQHRWNLLESGVSDKDQMVTSLTRKSRSLYHVIDVDNDEEKVMLWDFSYACFSKILDKKITKKEGNTLYEFYFDPDNGALLEIEFVEEFFGKYPYITADEIGFSKRGEALPDNIWEKLIDIDASLVVTPYKELEDLLHDHEENNKEQVDDAGEVFPKETEEVREEKEQTRSKYRKKDTEDTGEKEEKEDKSKKSTRQQMEDLDEMPF